MSDPREMAARLAQQDQNLAQAQSQAITPADNIRNMISKNMTRITQALPDAGLTPERLATVAFLKFRQNPMLLACTPESLVEVIIRTAQLGLDLAIPNHVHVVPYGNEATFQIGYQGLIELARRSGEIKTISARPVFEGDDFRWSYGLTDELVHRPSDGPQDWDHLTHVYMVAKFTGGGHHFGVMTKEQIEDHRDRYAKGLEKKTRGGDYTSPWKTAPIVMALKTIIRQEWKWLPVSIEVRQKVAETEAAEVDVINGGSVWLGNMEDAMPKSKPLPEPKPEPEPETPPTAPQDAPDPAKGAKGGGKAQKKGQAAKKAEPKPEDPKPERQTAHCCFCPVTIPVTMDASEADLVDLICDSCGNAGFTLSPPVAEGQQTLTDS